MVCASNKVFGELIYYSFNVSVSQGFCKRIFHVTVTIYQLTNTEVVNLTLNEISVMSVNRN